MLDEWQKFNSALMFYTRIPALCIHEHSSEVLNQSRKYFPAIGIIVGIIASIVFSVLSRFLTPELSIALSMVASILLTGAFHEDGLADSCDGLGGGWEAKQVLTIMKDSRIGTYGAIGLVSILAIKFLALSSLSQSHLIVFATCYIAGHTLSRQLASSIIERYQYVQDIEASKVKPITDRHLSKRDQLVSLCFTAIPLAALTTLTSVNAVLISVLASILVSIAFIRYCKRRIGGYTGDILGGVQQLSEVMFYLSLVAIS